LLGSISGTKLDLFKSLTGETFEKIKFGSTDGT